MKRLILIMLCCAPGLFAQSFLFSLRPELVAVSGAAMDSVSERTLDKKPICTGIARVSWTVESGLISRNGIFFTASVHSGFGEKENIGGFLNFGISEISEGGGAAFGGSLGFHKIPYHINVIHNGNFYDRYTDYNYIIGGVFFKLLLGTTNNFDITAKFLLGYRESNFVIYDRGTERYRYYYDDNSPGNTKKMVVVFSLSAGYTLTTNRR